jgi:hypothetical protein
MASKPANRGPRAQTSAIYLGESQGGQDQAVKAADIITTGQLERGF